MKRSLSVVLPVFNAERTLSNNLQHIFDVLSDLTEQFEVLVVDDGSTDQTMEVAHELSVLYPQLRVARRAGRHVAQAEHESNLNQAVGEVVFLQGARDPFSPSDVRRMWELCGSKGREPIRGIRRYDASGDDPGTQSAGRAPRPLAFLGRSVPQVGCIKVVRRPDEGPLHETEVTH